MARPHESVADMYDLRADEYNQEMDSTLQAYTPMLDEAIPMIPAGKGTIVDLGCGTGHMLSYLADRVPSHHSLIGVDISPRMIELARARLPETAILEICDVIRAAELDALRPAAAALLVCAFTLHFFSADECKQAISSWSQLLGKGGVLLLLFWSGEDDSYAFGPATTCYNHSLSTVMNACQCAEAPLQVVSQETKVDDEMGMEFATVYAMKA
eukprot:m.10068 g.10068  ORF g.10068 m.10068 type:complete len:213 (-) comp9577_c0_seq1:101-739(-)